MRYRQDVPDISGAVKADLKALEGVHMGAMTELVTGFKDELRDQVRGAGLGGKLANTWRGEVYPKSGSSLEPGGFVWSKAPKLIGAYARGATIVPQDGRRYLAIPTKNTPFKARGRLMTPHEVETAFNQDLIVRRGKRGNLLGFIDAVAAKSGKGFRQATTRRLKQGRASKLVLMFTFVRSVTVAKRIDPDGAFDRWAGRFDGLVQAKWDASALGRDR